MKRLLLTAAAGLMVAGPMSLPAFAQQGYGQGYQGQNYQGQRDQDRGYQGQDWGRNDDRGRDYGRNDDRGRDFGRDNDRGRDYRQVSQYHNGKQEWRDTRRNAQWNDRDHNGYYVGKAWRYGRPSAKDCRQRGFAYGYKPWQRGERLGSYNQRYGEVDYRDYQVQRPPQGYRWVKNDNGDLIMAAIVGGLIAAIISN